MRGGDFSGASFIVRDPQTGAPFSGQPHSGRAHRSGRATDHRLLLSAAEPAAARRTGGYGTYRQILPLYARPRPRRRARRSRALRHGLAVRALQLADARPRRVHVREHRRQRRHRADQPRPARSESKAHHAARSDGRASGRAHWSTSSAAATAPTRAIARAISLPATSDADARHRDPARWPLQAPGFPQFLFSGANRPSDIRDQRQNTFRDLDQSSFSLSSSTTWLTRRPFPSSSAASTRATTPRTAIRPAPTSRRARYNFTGFATGNSFADFLLGLPNHRARAAQHARQPADGHLLERLGPLRPGRLEDEPAASRFSSACATKSSACSSTATTSTRTSCPPTAATTSCPTAQIARPAAAGRQAARPHAASPTPFGVGRGADQHRPQQHQPAPRASRYRPGSDNKTVLRGGFGIFHPTGAAQGARDIMSRNPFRYIITNSRATLQHGFTTGTQSASLGFGNQGIELDLEARTSISTT